MATTKQRIKNLQRRINVRPDGLVGPDTLTRLEALVEQALGLPAVDAILVASRKSLDLIVRSEISSEAHYRRELAQPTWPGASSGVTIGIGYDLGFTSQTQIEKDWRGRIRDAELDRLIETQGVGGAAAAALIPRLRDITIPLSEAKEVFFQSSLPTYEKKVARIYPEVKGLPADAQGGLTFARVQPRAGPRYRVRRVGR